MRDSRSAAARGEPDVVRCRLCKRPYRRITGSHLYWKHHIDTGEYRDRFPNAPFFAEENKRELSKSIIRAWARIGRHWTKERVRRTIRTYQSQDRPLHALDIKKRHADLYTAAYRLYRSWDLALADAGLDPKAIRRRKVWKDDDLLAAMRQASASGALRVGAFFRRNHSGLVQTAVQRWGSWRAALAAAGLKPLRPAPLRWNRKVVIRQIQLRAERGESLLATELHSHAPKLREAAERFFKKTWPEIIRELGYEYSGRKRWSKDMIVRELQRLRHSGFKVNCESVRRSDPALAQAAARHFGAWPVALRAAGIDPMITKLRHWTRQELLHLFQTIRRAGKLSRRTLRDVQRPGYVQATTSIPKYWRSLDAAFRNRS